MKNTGKRICGILAAVLTTTLLLAGCTKQKAVPPAVEPPKGGVRGLFVHTLGNRDFPTEPGLPYGQVKDELRDLVSFSAANGLNTIFFEVRPSGDAVYLSDLFPVSDVWMKTQGQFTTDDPLADLIKEAAGEEIQVYAMVNPFYVGKADAKLHRKNPAIRLAKETLDIEDETYWNPASKKARETVIKGILEVATRYGVPGVTLHHLDDPKLMATEGYAENLETFLRELRAALAEQAPDRKVSVAFDGNTFPVEQVRAWGTEGLVDTILPLLTAPLDGRNGGYAALLERWNTAAAEANLKLIPVQNAGEVSVTPEDGRLYTDPYELTYQVHHNTLVGLDSSAISSYLASRDNPFGVAAMMELCYDSTDPVGEALSLSLTPGFAITRPQERLITDLPKYFITGISDPEVPLTLDGKEVPRRTESGLFGVLVDVPFGQTTYTFAQGEKTLTATLLRNRPPQGGTISNIPLGSMTPSGPTGVRVGEELKLRCTAPAGASVTATLGDITVPMKQAAPAGPGVAATYTGTLTLTGDYPADEVTRVGAVTYTLTWAGTQTVYTSRGELYAVGADADLIIEVSDYMAGVTTGSDAASAGDFITTLKEGAREIVAEDDDTHFALASGGYIRKAAVTILEGKNTAQSKVGRVTFLENNKQESFIISGATHAATKVEWDEAGISLTLQNTAPTDDEMVEVATGSSLFSEIVRSYDEEANATTYTFTLAEGQSLWGWDTDYNERGVTFVCRKRPEVSGKDGKPLTGITVVLDPGHGGIDPGALGVASGVGPHEATLNLAYALSTKRSLENLGAEVVLTHTAGENALDGDTRLDLFDRMKVAQRTQADFFISLHHNSTLESVDSNNASGVEVYYYTDNSETLAREVASRLSSSVGRPNCGAEQSYYVVTKVTFCPAILTEIGYMVNPAEYEALLDPLVRLKTANAIAGAVVEALGHSAPTPAVGSFSPVDASSTGE